MHLRQQTTLKISDQQQETIVAKSRNWVRWQWIIIVGLVLVDAALALTLAWATAYLFRATWLLLPSSDWLLGASLRVDLAFTISSIAVWVGLRSLLALYPGYGLYSVERLRRHVYSVVATFSIVTTIALVTSGEIVLLPQLGFVFLGLLFAAPLARYTAMKGLRSLGVWGRPVIVLTYRGAGMEVLRLLRLEWGQGYNPVALFDSNLVPAGTGLEEMAYHEALIDAVQYGRKQRIDTIFFAMPYTRREQLAVMVSQASENFRHVVIVPNLNGVTNSAVIARDFGGTFAVEMKHNLLDPWAQRLKRTLDVLGAGIGAIFISPLLIFLIVLIKLDSPGPVFYGHQRLGAQNRPFRCWKFRTMHVDADSLLIEWLQNNTELRGEWERNHKLRNDPRVTRVGRFLRKTSLDELPQLWNVVRGEMSLVGPRPIVEAEVPKYEEAYELYCRIRPGMTGFWQVSGRSNTDYRERVEMDVYFVRNWSVWLDVIILARTIKTVLSSTGAY